MAELTTIYVALLDEGTSVWRPVEAERVSQNTYRIVSQNLNPDDEQWEFPSGALVRCELHRFSKGEALAAVELAQSAV